MNLGAKAGGRARIGVLVVRDDKHLAVDDLNSLSAWWAIFRWNLHFGYYRVAGRNLLDLPKYLWRSLRP